MPREIWILDAGVDEAADEEERRELGEEGGGELFFGADEEACGNRPWASTLSRRHGTVNAQQTARMAASHVLYCEA